MLAFLVFPFVVFFLFFFVWTRFCLIFICILISFFVCVFVYVYQHIYTKYIKMCQINLIKVGSQFIIFDWLFIFAFFMSFLVCHFSVFFFCFFSVPSIVSTRVVCFFSRQNLMFFLFVFFVVQKASEKYF